MPNNFANQDGHRQYLTQTASNKAAEFVGRVAKDKEPNSRTIEVFVKDLLPHYSGKLEPKEREFEVGDNNWKGKATVTNTVKADWLGDDTNRRYPPDVKAGEQVTVIIHANQDKIYWTSKGRDDDKRRTERIEWNAANTPKDPEAITSENSYGISMDTQDKQSINLQTSNTGGEKNKYQIKIDAKNSRVSICDDKNNEISIESEIPRVYMKNSDGGLLEISKKNVTIIAPEDLLIKVGRQAVFDIPLLNFTNTKKSGTTIWNANEISFTCKTFLVTSPCIGFKGAVEASNIVAGPVYAVSYSTIKNFKGRSAGAGSSPFRTYRPCIQALGQGIGTLANNTPNLTGGFSNNRHCTAWEDMMACISQVADDLVRIDALIGYGNKAPIIISHANSSYMPWNTGE